MVERGARGRAAAALRSVERGSAESLRLPLLSGLDVGASAAAPALDADDRGVASCLTRASASFGGDGAFSFSGAAGARRSVTRCAPSTACERIVHRALSPSTASTRRTRSASLALCMMN